MKVLFLLFLFTANVYATPARDAAQLEQDLENGLLAQKAEKALSNLLYRASDELTKRGYSVQANEMITDWENNVRYSYRSYASGLALGVDDIGDHAGVSKKLQAWLQMLEFTLGKQIMAATHLSDLIVFNSINVCFRPCTFPMDNVPGDRADEYRRHMAEGDAYYGLIPVVSFWLCIGVSNGVGALFCSPVEMLVGKFVAPRISNLIFNKACSSYGSGDRF